MQRYRLIGSSPTKDYAVFKRQQTINDMLDGTGPVSRKVEVKGEDQVMEVVEATKPSAKPKLGPKAVKAI